MNTAFRLIKGYNTYGCPICFGKIKITIGNNIKYDLLPVRVGQTGFMYDKISGQLFGNSGSGNFILGNDVNSATVVSQAKQREMLNQQFEEL